MSFIEYKFLDDKYKYKLQIVPIIGFFLFSFLDLFLYSNLLFLVLTLHTDTYSNLI